MEKQKVVEIVNQRIKSACEKRSIDFAGIKLGPQFNLVESGVLDSIEFLEFITGIESDLGIELDLFNHDPAEFTNYDKFIEIIVKSK